MPDAVVADFLERIRTVRPQVKRLVLFGSRARGDHRTDSDYDLLVIVDRKSPALLDALYDGVVDVLLDAIAALETCVASKPPYGGVSGAGSG